MQQIELGRVLQAARVLRGESRTGLGARVRISARALARIEEGSRRPRPDELARLIDALGLRAPGLPEAM